MIELTDGATPVTLPASLFWENEYEWNPVEQEANFTLTGALVVEASTKQTGRPITLRSLPNMGWIPRSYLNQMYTWASEAGKELTLNLRGVSRTVVFDHEKGSIESELIGYHNDPTDAAKYSIVLRFLEIS